MITNIHFNSYKKLNNFNVDFKPGINIIAGNNGTCKSSILHVISNSYKQTVATNSSLVDNKSLKVIKSINKYVVPKIETLNKGSKVKNDPTNGIKGTVYTVSFDDGTTQDFRKHNSAIANRYSIKPKYPDKASEKLSETVVIYLSLDRLFPFPEFTQDDQIKKISSNLPQNYLEQIAQTFNDFTSHKIIFSDLHDMGNIKKRHSFSTQNEYVDSNTVSSGEDNLLIILTSLFSLIYYLDSLKENERHDVYLLIDEYDASLHPEFQIKLLNLVESLRIKYGNLHLVVTTHSLTTIEEALDRKYGLIYLVNRGTYVDKLNDPDLKMIKSDLHNTLHRTLYNDIKIPIITEDAEARVFLSRLFNHMLNTDAQFPNIHRFLDMVDASFPCETMKILFSSPSLPRRHFPAIGILDGDQTLDKKKYTNAILTLPGNNSPEKLAYEICKNLSTDNSENSRLFWSSVHADIGFSFDFMTKTLIPEFEKIERTMEDLKANGKSTKGVYRTESKKIFNEYPEVFSKLYDYWINHDDNKKFVSAFINDFKIAYYKICDYHSLPTNLWTK